MQSKIVLGLTSPLFWQISELQKAEKVAVTDLQPGPLSPRRDNVRKYVDFSGRLVPQVLCAYNTSCIAIQNAPGVQFLSDDCHVPNCGFFTAQHSKYISSRQAAKCT